VVGRALQAASALLPLMAASVAAVELRYGRLQIRNCVVAIQPNR
jgi:hypothetical protein